ncbi:unnamed protein product [Closterium sp. NIES-64]|nr:unnamed protein product [Closterium sp. NIES-64]
MFPSCISIASSAYSGGLLFHVPIQVRKSLAVADGLQIVGMVRSAVAPGHSGRLLRRQQRVVLTSEDKPYLEDQSLADEFALVRLLEEAAHLELMAPTLHPFLLASLSCPPLLISSSSRPDLEDLSLADEFALRSELHISLLKVEARQNRGWAAAQNGHSLMLSPPLHFTSLHPTEGAELHISLQKAERGKPWPGAIKGHALDAFSADQESRRLMLKQFQIESGQSLDAFSANQESRRLMLEQFQIENPGFDFPGAELTGSCPDPAAFAGGMQRQ